MKLFVAIPMYAQVPAPFFGPLAALLTTPPVPLTVRVRNGDGLLRARNGLTAEFLRSDCTDLLFIDNDILFTADDLARIVSHDVDIVGGMYPLKNQNGPTVWCLNGFPGQTTVEPDARGLLAVRYIGTGFLRIRRAVFEAMIAADRESIEYVADPPPPDSAPRHSHLLPRLEWDLWRQAVRLTDDGYKRYLTEDWLFCQRALDLGFKVWADTGVQLKHIGSATWPLPHQLENLQPSTSNLQP